MGQVQLEKALEEEALARGRVAALDACAVALPMLVPHVVRGFLGRARLHGV